MYSQVIGNYLIVNLFFGLQKITPVTGMNADGYGDEQWIKYRTKKIFRTKKTIFMKAE